MFEKEPLPADHPLWTMPGVLITPHTAGHGPYLDERRYQVLQDNARRFAEGRELRKSSASPVSLGSEVLECV